MITMLATYEEDPDLVRHAKALRGLGWGVDHLGNMMDAWSPDGRIHIQVVGQLLHYTIQEDGDK